MGEKGKQFGAAMGRYVIYILVAILVGGGFAGVRSFLSSHSKQFAKGNYQDLNPLVEAGKDLPVNEFGKLSVQWVVGTFATEENSYTSYGATFDAGKSYYYMALLSDLSIIAVQANDKTEVQRLEDMAKEFEKSDDVFSLPAQDFEGKIQAMTNTKLKGFYDSALKTAGFSADPAFSPKYIVLNTGAIPSQNVALIVGVVALAVVALIVVARTRKKRRAEAAQASAPTDFQQPTE